MTFQLSAKAYPAMLSLAIALLLACAGQRLYTRVFLEEYADNFQSVYPSRVAKEANLEFDGTYYTATSNDPQFVVQLDGETVDGVKVRFRKRLEADMNVTVYYDAGAGFSEANSAGKNAPAGARTVYIDLPKAEYQALRVAIGNAPNQRFSLSDIQITGELRRNVPWGVFAALLLAAFVLCYANFEKMRLCKLTALSLPVSVAIIIFLQKYGLRNTFLLLCVAAACILEVMFRMASRAANGGRNCE